MGDPYFVTLGRWDAPRQMTLAQAAYFAGMVDGEGSISVSAARQRNIDRLNYRLAVTVTNTDIKALETLGEWVGVGYLSFQRRSQKDSKWKDAGVLKITHEASAFLLRQIQPFLIIKAEQAALALEFIELKRLCSKQNDNIGQQAKIHRQMKKLNGRGRAYQKEYNFIRPEKIPRLCTYDGCIQAHYGNGYCRQHYRWVYESKTWNPEQTTRQCQQCEGALPANSRIDAKFCSTSCKMKWHRSQGCYTSEALADAPKCAVEDCDRPRHARAMCRRHYMREWHAEQREAVIH